MADDISRFDPNYEKSLQVVSSVDSETSLNLKGDPTNNNALYTSSTVSSSALPSGATGINGGDVTVGTTEVAMTFTGVTKSVSIQSKVTNTGSIWVGLTGVTNTGGNAFAQLSPGQSVSIDLDDASAALFAISDIINQVVYTSALT